MDLPPDALPLPSLGAMQIVWLLVGLGLVRALSETLRAHLAARLQLGVIHDFRGKLLRHVLGLEPSKLLDWPAGELASRIQVEVHGVRTLLHVGVGQGIWSILVATALAGVALRVDTALAIPGLLALPLAVLVIVVAARPARRLQRELFGAETRVVSDTAEAVDGAAVLRAYGAVEQTWASIDANGARSERRGIEAETWSSMAGPLVELAGALGIALVVALAWTRGRSVDFASAGTVLVALLLMYRPLHGLAQSLFGWWSGLAALDRLDELWSLRSEAVAPTGVRGEPFDALGLSSVRFDYDGRPVLRGVSASFHAGELIVIAGESGAGKSTLLGLLAGVLPLREGEVRIDGARASRESRMAASAWMPQTPALFGDTILKNVALGDPSPDRDRVIEVCRRVRAHEFIAARPQAYDGLLHEGGSDLSAGQRQRITLARALYRGAPLWLLDEPSSALDDEQERNVIRICREHADLGGLVIVASHREGFLQNADRVLELKDGTGIEWERPGQDALLH